MPDRASPSVVCGRLPQGWRERRRVAVFVAVNVAGLSTEWRLPAGDAMGAVPLLLSAMPKTSERCAEHSIQRKLDAIARAMLEQQEGTRGKAHEDLKDAIRMEERL
ncbi:hypothetical protein [Streptomyces sp. NPDC002467]|uniref:hypothetical protein n=1 Tax=Streptomyces sp. NPDC002467 TaxID=3364647 RepID=UPI00369F45DB